MDHSSWLRKALAANAVFSAACGLVTLLAPSAVAGFLGLSEPAILSQLGLSLLVFAALLTATARARRIRPWVAALFTLADLDWVAGTALLLLTRPELLSTAGTWTAIAVADVVALLAILQTIGIIRLVRGIRQQRASTLDGVPDGLPGAA